MTVKQIQDCVEIHVKGVSFQSLHHKKRQALEDADLWCPLEDGLTLHGKLVAEAACMGALQALATLHAHLEGHGEAKWDELDALVQAVPVSSAMDQVIHRALVGRLKSVADEARGLLKAKRAESFPGRAAGPGGEPDDAQRADVVAELLGRPVPGREPPEESYLYQSAPDSDEFGTCGGLDRFVDSLVFVRPDKDADGFSGIGYCDDVGFDLPAGIDGEELSEEEFQGYACCYVYPSAAHDEGYHTVMAARCRLATKPEVAAWLKGAGK